MGRLWDDVLTQRDRLVYEAGGFGQRQGFGKRPAVLVIDVNYNFCGDKPEPILESMKRFRNSCGEEAWQAVPKIKLLLDAARAKKVPVIYTTAYRQDEGSALTRWGSKNRRTGSDPGISGDLDQKIVAEIAPLPGEILIKKHWPSGFFGTPLISFLNALGVDSLIVCGCVTSGCVRATVVDAFSYNFLVTVVEECTFDRAEVSHKVALLDMDSRNADVVPLSEVLEQMQSGFC